MDRIQKNYLDQWHKKKNRRPLILRGARQVGKSTLVRLWCEKNDFDLFEVNLDKHQRLNSVFEKNEMEFILREIESIAKKALPRSKKEMGKKSVVIFFDEIQETPYALKALRYFYEDFPHIAVVAAGSLLEFVLSEHDFDMPVGRIEYCHMGPMTFAEFLAALGENFLLEQLEQREISSTTHQQCLDLFRTYLFVGGMPEAVLQYVESRSLQTVMAVHAQIVDTYRDDFSKYAKRGKEMERIRNMFDFVALHTGEKIKYSKISSDHSSRELKKCLQLLWQAKIVTPVYHSSSSAMPLERGKDETIFKLLHLDVGLMNHMSGVTPSNLGRFDERKLFHEGSIAEQFVGQHILNWREPYLEPKLFYWLRKGKSNNAEVDYLVEIDDAIVAIEVKSGKSGTLRSLHQWNKDNLALNKKSLRFDLNLPSTQFIEHQGAQYHLVSLPIYLASWPLRLS